MRIRRAQQPTVLCPVCSTERERPTLRLPLSRILFLSVAWGAACAASLWLLLGGWAAAVGGIAGGVLSFLAQEVYYSVKFKAELACPVCQFDPLLYRRAPEEAQRRCRESLRQKEAFFVSRLRAGMENPPGGETRA